MDSRTRSIIIGIAALFILAILFGIIFYFNWLSSKPSQPTLPQLSSTPGPQVLPTPVSASATTTQTKIYAGQGFEFDYPANWGLLTCQGNQNIEFDPVSSTDQKNVACNEAVKPITVIVSDTCPGQTITLGNNQVTKSTTNISTGHVDYEWCLNVAGKGLDITHRVSVAGAPAHSKLDYSAQVEQMISTIRPSAK